MIVDAPRPGSELDWVRAHLAHVSSSDPVAPGIRGGQSRADAALAAFDVRRYAATRNEVWPEARRGASRLSPYIRHGLISLPRAWDAAGGGPFEDRRKFRDELLWQEYARHLYARLGTATGSSLRYHVPDRAAARGWPTTMRCVADTETELRDMGWITNQQRMWLASHWSVRSGMGWRDGEDAFFRSLLDGSRAANRLGWQWTTGALTGSPYGFSRWQVETRAPGTCDRCPLSRACPIEDWPDATDLPKVDPPDPRLRADDDVLATAGPIAPVITSDPSAVWLTAESLGDDDPALVAHPDLPAHFVFDLPLLARLRLAGGRLVFIAECLADLSTRRDVRVHVGDPAADLSGVEVAATYAPVPGWRRHRASIAVVAEYPWPWLTRPTSRAIGSFSSWRKGLRGPVS